MKYKEVSFVLGCIVIISVGGFFLLPKVFKEFQDEEIIRVRVSLENKCSITDDAFVVLDDPFVHMDTNRLTQAIDIVKSFSNKHPVIFFTCHENQAALLRN